MKQINYKKLILPNIPYVFFVYLFDKVGQAVRLAPRRGYFCKDSEMIAYMMQGNFPELLSLSIVTTCVSKYNKHLEESEMYPFTN